MSIIVGCPFCKSRLSVKSLSNRIITCPTCKQVIQVENLLTQSDGSATAMLAVPATPTTSSRVPMEQGIDLSLLSKPQSLLGSPKSPPPLPLRVAPKPGDQKASLATPEVKAAHPPEVNQADHGNAPALADASGMSEPPVPLAIPLVAPSRSSLISSPNQVSHSASSASIGSESSSGQPMGEGNPDVSLLNGSKGSVHAAILKRQKRQRLFFFVTNSILAILTLGIAGALYWQLTTNPDAFNLSEPTVANEQSTLHQKEAENSASTAKKTVDDKLAKTIDAKDETDITPQTAAITNTASTSAGPKTPPPPQYSFFSKKQVIEIWKATKPGLVALQIEGPSGTQRAVGLIVDSRGWIVTSHQAVKDATRIEVTSATEPMNQPDQNIGSPLVDMVRGHVINDPSNDLAILAINRRFVVSLAEPEVADKDRLVEQIRLLALAPPSTTNFYGVQEVHIEKRSSFDQLPLATKSKIELLKIGKPDLSWMIVQGKTEWLPGTPLLDRTGSVEAMVSFSREKHEALAVSLAPLKDLLRKASGDIQPLKLNVALTDGNEVAIDPEHVAYKAQLALNAAANSCRDFGWLPGSQDQYDMLLEFSKRYVAGRDLVSSYDKDYRDSAESAKAYEDLENLSKQLAAEIKTRLLQALEDDESQIARLNEFAEPLIEKSTETLVPLCGTVVQSGLQLDQFIVQLDGLDTFCVIPFDPTARPLRPDSHWFLILETSKSNMPSDFKLGGDRSIRAYSAFQRLEIGPLKSK